MTCRIRSSRSGVGSVVSLLLLPAAAQLLFVAGAQAAELPPIRTTASNAVAECATPGRLMAYIRQKNPKLDPKYDEVASDYVRHGSDLGVRYDYAFFQMLLETGYLTYTGDVKPSQNNFAGLGATGKGARGESFKDISTGARAHLEHLVMYSGERVEAPVAERTRNIQEWGVLTDWQKGLTGPITFTQLAKQWAPGSRRYAVDIETIANRFFDGICKEPDPQPDLVADSVGSSKGASQKAAVTEAPPVALGLEAQKRALETAKNEGGAARSALGAPAEDTKLPTKGAAAVAEAAKAAKAAKSLPQTAAAGPPVTLLNPTAVADATDAAVKTDAAAAKTDAAVKTGAVAKTDIAIKASASKTTPASVKTSSAAKEGSAIEVAALPGPLKGAGKVEKKETPSASKCRVWTASYGGAKAIIIKATQDKTVNYTVLDVNEGTEKREADAYINAYAKGGSPVGEFQSQSQALEKAFELCPEG